MSKAPSSVTHTVIQGQDQCIVPSTRNRRSEPPACDAASKRIIAHECGLRMYEPSRPIATQVYRVYGTDVETESILVSEKRNSPGLAPIDRCHCYSAPPSNTPCHPTPQALAPLHSGAAAFRKPSTAAAAKGVQYPSCRSRSVLFRGPGEPPTCRSSERTAGGRPSTCRKERKTATAKACQ